MADTETKFSEKIGWMMAGTDRTARYAMVIDHGKVIYAEKEPGREIGVSAIWRLLHPPPLTILGLECRCCPFEAVKS